MTGPEVAPREPDEGSFTVLLGGARSGKSTLAQRLAVASGRPVIVVVTAEAGDDPEMVRRVEAHRADRPDHWRTVEAPRSVAEAVATADTGATVLVDCATLWLANLLLEDWPDPGLRAASDALIDACTSRSEATIVVSNEVGSGIVPMEALSRRFRDEQGRLNQRLVAASDRAFLVVGGRLLALSRPEDLLPELDASAPDNASAPDSGAP